ncbi:prepilin-type N-terminal cleavage/methylation domain-containing protein [Exiguobacterium sp.]|uniref:PilW family protein n=1 Tax=Exiguobacterium sp. TaxID=44751 RepID=UPI0028A5B700|nr:prepilin-type N-terminal cleavage/methylation domain-containing protein [Exiguobacterium sp.]
MRRSIKVFRRQNDGFSLVELLVAIVIASIFSAVILTVFISGTKSFRATGIISELRSEADSRIGIILNEISGFDAIRIDEAQQLSFYKKTLPTLNPDTGLLERASGFQPFNAIEEATSSNTNDTPIRYTFAEQREDGTELIYESAPQFIDDHTELFQTFTLSSPEYQTIKSGNNSSRYIIHGILTITTKIQSTDQEEVQTFKSMIGF